MTTNERRISLYISSLNHTEILTEPKFSVIYPSWNALEFSSYKALYFDSYICMVRNNAVSLYLAANSHKFQPISVAT